MHTVVLYGPELDLTAREFLYPKGYAPGISNDPSSVKSKEGPYSTHYASLICNLTHGFWNHGVNISPVS